MFFGSDHGGERGALLYGLIGTCRLNDIDPEAYLSHMQHCNTWHRTLVAQWVNTSVTAVKMR